MRKDLKITLFALGAFVMGGLTSCSLEGDPSMSDSNSMLVKAPKVVAYSGNHYWNNGTRSKANDGDLNNREFWQSYGADELENITDQERQAVLDAINQKTNNGTRGQISEDLVFPWTAYFLQDVICGQNGKWTNAGSNNGTSASYSMEAFRKGADCRVQSQWYTDNHTNDYENYEQVTNSAHMNSYYLKGDSQERIEETTLMYDMTPGTYEEMRGRQFRWYINCHENLHWSEYIVVEVDGSYYICFDFACGHPENDFDGNPGKGAEHNDWDYNDWILKITPAGNQPDVWTGETPEEPEKCDKCDHPTHDPGNCPECDENEGCNHQDTPDQPEKPEIAPEVQDHVEVNLSIEDHNYTQTDSHLSIHVRSATDVEVFIPVPAMYYCDADDMAIVEKHLEELMLHGGPTRVEYDVNGHTVTLNVAFEADGIRIWTDGINEEVIAYCREKYNDGITFEVWNYFNETISKEELKTYLDRATVKFLDKLPDAYVNAFNDLWDDPETKFEWDCTVSIVDDQRGQYNDPEEGLHYNGSKFNEIYKNKNAGNGSNGEG